MDLTDLNEELKSLIREARITALLKTAAAFGFYECDRVEFERETDDIAIAFQGEDDSRIIGWISDNDDDEFAEYTGDPLIDCVDFQTA